MPDFVVVVFASIAAGLLSLSVALILLSSEKLSSKLVKYGTPFAAGVLLMIGFRDLLPEGIAEEGVQVLNATLGAIVIFFLIEKGFNSFHHHHEEDKPKDNKTQGWLFVVGDVFHNLIDGISLGGAFLLGRDTGLIATVALISHDIPLEVGEFGNQLRVGFTKRQTIVRNIVSGLTTVLGAVLTYQVGGDLDLPMGYLYGGIAGFFIYIALSDIVPIIHSSEKARYGLQTGFLLFGLVFGGTVSALAHDYIDVGHNHGHHDDHDEEGHDDHDEEGHDDHDEEGHDDHDEEGHDDHDEEGHDDHDEEGHDDHVEVDVPSSAPEKIQVLNFEVGEEIELHFSSATETEVHIHGYDIHYMVYPDKENVLKINLTTAGEFEIEDHDGGFEFARLVVSP
jgi:zinc and cadmium transporter